MADAAWPFPGPVQASLSPPDLYQYAGNPSVVMARTPLYYPNPFLPYDQHGRVAHTLRDRIINETTAGNLVVNTEYTNVLRFGEPGVVYALTGGASRPSGAAFPVGWDPLDTFNVRFERSDGDRLVTVAGRASAILGRGWLPRYLVGPAWLIDSGTPLTYGITALIADLAVTVNVMCVEIRGPTNVQPR